MFQLKTKPSQIFTICALATSIISGCSTPPPETPIGQIATRQFEAQNWEVAINKYTQAMAQDGPRYSYQFNRGVCYKELGRNKDAISDFIKADSIRPHNDGQALFQVASLYLQSGQFTQAIKFADTLLNDNSSNSKVLEIRKKALLGRVQQSMDTGQLERALADLDVLIKSSPDEINLKLMKAKSLFLVGKNIETRKETDDYLQKLIRTVHVNSIEWKQMTKMRAINLFHMKSAQHVRVARKVFDTYLNSNKAAGLSSDDAFWAGLIARVCLDTAKGDEYWSKLSKSYIEKRKKELKNNK